VGLIDRSEELLFDAIVKGYRLPPTAVSKSFVPANEWLFNSIASVLDSKYDIVYAYIVPGSPFHTVLASELNISVIGFKSIDVDRVKHFYPNISSKQVSLMDFFKNTGNVSSKNKFTTILTLRQMRVSVPPSNVLSGSIVETFAGFMPLPNDMMDDGYTCIGDSDIHNKQACQSPYDYRGNPKRMTTVWDKPCTKNEECAFFDPVQNRGGCSSGSCEFPVGVKRLGFTKFDGVGTNAPFCKDIDAGDDVPATECSGWVFPNK
jgi:hypothetical protein